MKIRKERLHSKKFLDILKDYMSFYNKTLRRKHIIIYIISLLIFAYLMKTFIDNTEAVKQLMTEVKHVNIFSSIIKEKIPVTFLLIFSGVTPYVYIPIIGIFGYPYLMASQLIGMSAFNILIACIGSVIQIFGISLAIAAGVYYCSCSTKKVKYSQTMTFGLDDVREQIYEARNNEEKLNKVREKKQSKKEKREKLNVKIEYKQLVITFIISVVIVVVTALITGV